MIDVSGLVKKFKTRHGEPVTAVAGVQFSVPEGKIFSLLGPSGCGKTTLLRLIAGLERPDAGEIKIGDTLVCSIEQKTFVPPNERNIGMVFQSYAIWPHMTVFDNVAFPLTLNKKKYRRKEIAEKVDKILEVVHLDGYQERPAPNLSGGQQQRLALARALVHEPKILLLDEPLSNLDAKLREDLRFELRQIQRQLGITTLYVTHDQTEALSISDHIAVILDGKIIQQGAPRQLFEQPASQFTADFIGSTNFLDGVVEENSNENGDRWVKTTQGRIRCAIPTDIPRGARVQVTIRPRNIQLSDPSQKDHDNIFFGRVLETAFLGDYVDCQAELGDQQIRFYCDPMLQFSPGDAVYLRLPGEYCTVLMD